MDFLMVDALIQFNNNSFLMHYIISILVFFVIVCFFIWLFRRNQKQIVQTNLGPLQVEGDHKYYINNEYFVAKAYIAKGC